MHFIEIEVTNAGRKVATTGSDPVYCMKYSLLRFTVRDGKPCAIFTTPLFSDAEYEFLYVSLTSKTFILPRHWHGCELWGDLPEQLRLLARRAVDDSLIKTPTALKLSVECGKGEVLVGVTPIGTTIDNGYLELSNAWRDYLLAHDAFKDIKLYRTDIPAWDKRPVGTIVDYGDLDIIRDGITPEFYAVFKLRDGSYVYTAGVCGNQHGVGLFGFGRTLFAFNTDVEGVTPDNVQEIRNAMSRILFEDFGWDGTGDYRYTLDNTYAKRVTVSFDWRVRHYIITRERMVEFTAGVLTPVLTDHHFTVDHNCLLPLSHFVTILNQA